MSNSTIDIVFDVTDRAKEIFARENNGEQGHVLIDVDKIGNNEPISSYFIRGATSIVDGEVFDREKYARATNLATISEIDMQYEKKFTDMNPVFGNIGKYKMQNFIYNIAGMFNIALGQDSYYYKPRFSNGKVCHIWKENINGEDHFCMLSVEDGLSIEIPIANDDREKYYVPGAVILEIKVPASVLENMEPITDKHITRVLVTSGKLFDLLDVNPNLISLLEDDSTEKGEELKKTINASLESRESKEPLHNLGDQIKEPNFKDTLPEAVNKKRMTFYTKEESKPSSDDSFDSEELENTSCFDKSETNSEGVALSDGQRTRSTTPSNSTEDESGRFSPCLEEPVVGLNLEELYFEDIVRVDSERSVSSDDQLIVDTLLDSVLTENGREKSSPSKGSDLEDELSRARSPGVLLFLSGQKKPEKDSGLDYIPTSFHAYRDGFFTIKKDITLIDKQRQQELVQNESFMSKLTAEN